MRKDFCRNLLDDDSIPLDSLDPERLAARFVRCFKLSGRPTLDELSVMLSRAGFGEVSDREMDGLKGAHIGEPRGHYAIYYRQGLWDGSSTHTVLHETFEIINETLWDIHSGDTPDRKVCREADRFAAAVLMQPEAFASMAEASGFDALALQRQYRCSYASVTIRLAEVIREQPLMAVLYEREEKGDPAGWTGTPALRATVARRTRGFGTPDHLPRLRLQGRRSPQGQDAPGRLPGGAGRPLRHGAVRPRRRLRRHSPSRRLEGEAGKGGRHRRAGRRLPRPRPPGHRLGWDRAQAARGCGGWGWPLVGLDGR